MTNNNRIIKGHALDVLRTLPSESVQMCATSPPYYGLRDYGCPPATFGDGWTGQLGHEDTPDLFVAHLVEVFAEVRRVLTPSGVLFVNMGDSYNGSGGSGGDYAPGGIREGQPRYEGRHIGGGIKPKDLIGAPWLLAFALRADGWYLRSDIIWAKGVSFCPTYSGSCMPEPTKDRPTSSHEHVFLLSKAQRYYYDADAVRESHAMKPQRRPNGHKRRKPGATIPEHTWSGTARDEPGHDGNPASRNLRNVWTINPKPYAGAHFAVWPPALVAPMVKAGSSEHGCCPACAAPWERVVERGKSQWAEIKEESGKDWRDLQAEGQARGMALKAGAASVGGTRTANGTTPSLRAASSRTTGWRPICDCPDAKPVPCTVLDPFAGSGTTGIVAVSLGRRFIGIDINGGDCDLGGHTAQERVQAAAEGQSLEEHQAGQTTLLALL